jgi:ketosteroid isomerase-like protein
MKEHPNVALVRRWFEAVAAGDLQTAVAVLSPGLRYHGCDDKGEARQFRDRDELFAMFLRAVAQTDEYTNAIVDALPVGETLVMTHVRAHRRAKHSGESVDDDFVMALRIEHGQITHGADLCGPAFVDFWRRNGGV